MTYKQCNDCGERKHVDEFHRDSRCGYRSSCKACRKAHGDKYATPEEQPARPGESFETAEASDSLQLESNSRRIRTVAEALAKGGVDLAVWEVDRSVVNSYEVAMKLDADGSGTAETCHVETLWQVKVTLKRRVSRVVEDGLEALIGRMQRWSPKYPKSPKMPRVTDPHMLEINLSDVHFAKLAWAAETGQDYDLKIAESLFDSAVDCLLAKASGFPIERITFPIGNDFYHVDGQNNATAAGTPQDVDGRFVKMFEVGQMAVIRAVEKLQQVAPVDVVLVRGNHDWQTSVFLAKIVKVWFRHCDRVAVDDSPAPRKYVAYGNSLVGYTHGSEEKIQSLPGIMATEVPHLWQQATRSRRWHLGHYHTKRQTHYAGVNTIDGVVVHHAPSLSAQDLWHAKKGYLGSRAAEAHLFSKEYGHTGYFVANVIDGDRVA